MRVQVIQEELGAQFTNASIVLGSGLIFDSGFGTAYSLNPFDPDTDLLQEEVTRRIFRQKTNSGLDFQFAKQPTIIGSINTTVFPLCTAHPHNYFHFLIEALPELLFFLNNDVIDNESLILTGHLHPNMRDALYVILGERRLPILQLDFMQQIDCQVIHAGPGSVFVAEKIDGSWASSTFRPELLIGFRELFRKYWPRPSEYVGKKIMVSRQSYMRHLVNAQQLEAIASQAGYMVVQPEKLTLMEQIKLFSSASRIIGPTGAWLANLGFVRESVPVTVLLPETCITNQPLWSGLGRVFDVTVHEKYCPISELHENAPIHSNFHCPLNELLDLL